MLDQSTAIFRLLIAFGLGFALGLERELRGQDAGLRTHILVSLGSCLFTVSSILIEQPLDASASQEVRADVTRIASQVVVGIGFLGGGAILRHGASIKGLTTAANLWLTASVGLTVGIGFPLTAAATTGLALLALVGLRFLEGAILRFRKKHRFIPEENLASRTQNEHNEDTAERRK
jgi:putative Mg2+ transporter-C (MgtC) family protein